MTYKYTLGFCHEASVGVTSQGLPKLVRDAFEGAFDSAFGEGLLMPSLPEDQKCLLWDII